MYLSTSVFILFFSDKCHLPIWQLYQLNLLNHFHTLLKYCATLVFVPLLLIFEGCDPSPLLALSILFWWSTQKNCSTLLIYEPMIKKNLRTVFMLFFFAKKRWYNFYSLWSQLTLDIYLNNYCISFTGLTQDYKLCVNWLYFLH